MPVGSLDRAGRSDPDCVSGDCLRRQRFAERFKRPGKLKVRKKREPRIVLGERLEPEETATDLLSEAEALARRGELRAAIRKAYIALLVELGDRKLISLAQHKTNRDYLNSLRNVPPLHSRMRGLTESFERHWYGFAEASKTTGRIFAPVILQPCIIKTNARCASDSPSS